VINPEKEILTTRVLALLPVALFLPTLVSYVVAPGSTAPEYSGILFHVAFLFLVGRLDAPDWAKGAAYGWLALDIATGSLVINGIPYDTAISVRLGGHVLAAVWFISVAQLSTGAVRLLGTVVGAWLGLYTFVSAALPRTALQPAGALMIIWLILLAVGSRPSSARLVTADR
jgi:hypothetical protein